MRLQLGYSAGGARRGVRSEHGTRQTESELKGQTRRRAPYQHHDPRLDAPEDLDQTDLVCVGVTMEVTGGHT